MMIVAMVLLAMLAMSELRTFAIINLARFAATAIQDTAASPSLAQLIESDVRKTDIAPAWAARAPPVF
jgi:hypothetical protein